jgi:Zn finger protein HypA/HybF involved in hydrogenase expression
MSDGLTFKTNCAKCDQSLEVPEEMRGQTIVCPTCGKNTVTITLDNPASKYADIPEGWREETQTRVAAPPFIPQATVPVAKIKREIRYLGIGFFIQILGGGMAFISLVLGFIFVAVSESAVTGLLSFCALGGLFFGIALLIFGHYLSIFYRCPECLNKVENQKVKLCPTCHAKF